MNHKLNRGSKKITPEEQLIKTMMEGINKFYALQLSDRVRKGIKAKKNGK